MIVPTNYTKNLNDLSDKDKSFILEHLEKNYTSEIFYNQEIMMVMKNIFLDMSHIYESLEVLEHAGIDFTLSLVGGALRDLLSENYTVIKDLDIVLSINNIKDYSQINDTEMLEDLDNNHILKSSIEMCKEKYSDWQNWNIDKKIASLVQVNLGKKLQIKQTYIPLDLPKEMKDNGVFRSNYHNIFLRGVIKLEDEKLHYPTDILICNSTAEQYINTFDFNICKIMLSISSQQFKEMSLNFNWNTLENIKNQIIPTNDFWIDLVYKKLTLNPMGFDMNALERAIIDHLPRIQKKYPEHTLDLIKYNKSNLVKEEVKDYLTKMNDFITLNENFPTKEDSRRIKPKKI